MVEWMVEGGGGAFFFSRLSPVLFCVDIYIAMLVCLSVLSSDLCWCACTYAFSGPGPGLDYLSSSHGPRIGLSPPARTFGLAAS